MSAVETTFAPEVVVEFIMTAVTIVYAFADDIGDYKVMQDAHSSVKTDKSVIINVADGHGSQYGHFVAKAVVGVTGAEEKTPEEDIAIRQGFADKTLQAAVWNSDVSGLTGGATFTQVCVNTTTGDLSGYYVGDSPVVVFDFDTPSESVSIPDNVDGVELTTEVHNMTNYEEYLRLRKLGARATYVHTRGAVEFDAKTRELINVPSIVDRRNVDLSYTNTKCCTVCCGCKVSDCEENCTHEKQCKLSVCENGCNHKYVVGKIFPSDVRNSKDLGVAFPNGLSLNLSRALGDNAYKPYGVIDTPSVFSLAAVSGKTRVIVVSSDGCGDMLHYYATPGVHENDMWKIIKENFGNPDATARALVAASKVATDKFFGASGQQDNIAVAVIYVTYP